MEGSKKGGKREGAGRKPTDNPKQQVTLYVPKKEIYPFGNVDKLKGKLYDFISNFHVQDLTKPNVEVKPFEQPKTNYFVSTAPKQRKTPQEWVVEKRAIADGDNETYQRWIRDLDDCDYLSERQKREIKFA